MIDEEISNLTAIDTFIRQNSRLPFTVFPGRKPLVC